MITWYIPIRTSPYPIFHYRLELEAPFFSSSASGTLLFLIVLDESQLSVYGFSHP